MRTVYHLDLNKKKIEGSEIVLLPGDPFRSPQIADYISNRYQTTSREIAWKREYRSFLAEVDKTKILITSTGIGGPSTSIAVDELAQLGLKIFIRVGTTGAIQDFINIGDVIITSGSVRFDGASTHYAPIEYPAVAYHEVLNALIEGAKEEKVKYHVGITASSDTFYTGEERKDGFFKMPIRKFQGITEELKRLNVLNYEMESSTILTLCSTMGLKGGCVTGVINTRTKDEKINSSALKLGEENAIRVAVKAVEILIVGA